MPQYQTHILGGIRRVHDLGPRGGERTRFQVWIERRGIGWAADGSHITHHYGETFARQWEAAQAALVAAERCRALESVGAFLVAASAR